MRISYLSILALIILISQLGFTQNKSGSKRRSVAVLELQSSGGLTAAETSALTNRFRGILVSTQVFDVLEREKMSEILKEQDFIMSDNCNSSECAVQVGQLLGVEAMIAGDIGKVGNLYTIDLRIINVESGKIENTQSVNHSGDVEGLLTKMNEAALAFANVYKKKMTWLYILSGSVVAGGTAAYLILTKKEKPKGIQNPGFPSE